MTKEEHEAWLAEKIADGWTWGKELDETLKKSPYIVHFEQLPVDLPATEGGE
jgi:RyR domain-containing protein